MSVATGNGFLSAGTDVLYITFEDRVTTTQYRLELMSRHSGPLPIDFAETAPRLDQELVRLLRQWVSEHPEAQLIVLDPLAHVMPKGSNLNKYEDVVGALRPLHVFSRETGISIVIPHHSRKRHPQGSSEDPFSEILGSIAAFGTVDTALIVHDTGSPVLHAKGRELSERHVPLERSENRIGWERDERDPSLAELRGLSGRKRDVTDALEELGGTATLAELANRLGLTSNNLNNVLKKLRLDGIVTREGKGLCQLNADNGKVHQSEGSSAATLQGDGGNEVREDDELEDFDLDLTDLGEYVDGDLVFPDLSL